MAGESGYRCVVCGGTTATIDTRVDGNGFIIRRKRRCYQHEHVFNTFEISERIWGAVSKEVQHSAHAIYKAIALYKRNAGIVDKVLAGELVKNVAAEYDIASNTVSHILRKAGIKPRHYRKNKDAT